MLCSVGALSSTLRVPSDGLEGALPRLSCAVTVNGMLPSVPGVRSVAGSEKVQSVPVQLPPTVVTPCVIETDCTPDPASLMVACTVMLTGAAEIVRAYQALSVAIVMLGATSSKKTSCGPLAARCAACSVPVVDAASKSSALIVYCTGAEPSLRLPADRGSENV